MRGGCLFSTQPFLLKSMGLIFADIKGTGAATHLHGYPAVPILLKSASLNKFAQDKRRRRPSVEAE